MRRRTMWWPTLWGWLLLVTLGVLLGIATVLVVARGLHGLLAPNEPARGADGRGARTLVVEGWMDDAELAQAVLSFERGHYERVLVTGGPIESWQGAQRWGSYAARAAVRLRLLGLTEVPIVAVPAPASLQERTYLSAVMLREWSQSASKPLAAIDLVSAGVHARRSRLLFRWALGDAVEVGVLAVRPTGYDEQRWWTSSAGSKAVLGEAIGLAWTLCCFKPPAPGTHEERWAEPAPAASFVSPGAVATGMH
jgi:hypothetical protein